MTKEISIRANLSLGLGIAALAFWVLGVSATGESGEENGWIWVLMAVFGVAALATALSASEGRPRGRALAGAIIGALGVTVFLVFAIADALG